MALHLFHTATEAVTAERPLVDCLPVGRLIELSGDRRSARYQTAVSIVRHAQLQGETTAWVKHISAPLFPPDLNAAGIDLDSLIVANLPTTANPYALPRTAELLLRSGGFGLVVIDLSNVSYKRGGNAWQGRLLALAREHQSQIVLITTKTSSIPSLGPLVSLRVEPTKKRIGPFKFQLQPVVLKDKSGVIAHPSREVVRGPWGLH